MQHDIPKDVTTSESSSYSLLIANDADSSSDHVRVSNRKKTYRVCQRLIEVHYLMTMTTL